VVGTGVNVYKYRGSLSSPHLSKPPHTGISSGIFGEDGSRIEKMPSIVYGDTYSFCIRVTSQEHKVLYLILLEDYEQIPFSLKRNIQKKYIHIIYFQKNNEETIKINFTPSKRGNIIIEPMIIDIYDYPYDPNTHMAYTAGRFMNMVALTIEVR
jgi:hypothetical protein